MPKINNLTAYPSRVPAAGDHVIGTDISDTAIDVNGKTVTYTFQAITDFVGANINLSTSGLSDWPAGVSAVELGYLDGVSSPIQAQLNGKASTGQAVIAGGTFGQVLSKASASDYDLQWVDGNQPDAYLLDRAHHTGEQDVSTITGLGAQLSTLTLKTKQAQTGHISGGLLTIEPGNLIGVAAGTGVIINRTDPVNPIAVDVSWEATTIPAPTLPQRVRYIYADAAGAIQFASSYSFFGAGVRNAILLGVASINEAGNLNYVFNVTPPAAGLFELSTAIGPINLSGNVFSGATGLAFQKSAGSMFAVGIQEKQNQESPNVVSNPSFLSTTNAFTYVWTDNAGGFNVKTGATLLAAGVFDDGTSPPGALLPSGAVSTNSWTYQIVYMEPETARVFVQFGNDHFASLDDARASAKSFTRYPPLDPVPTRAIIYIRGGATNASSDADVVFEDLGKFGLVSASGIGASGGGEINTASNLGAGQGLFANKVGVDLQFKGLGAGTNITLTPTADTLTISTPATVNSTDSQLRDRSTHTGTQAISTVTGLQTALDGKLGTTATAAAAVKLETARTIALSGDVSGSVAFDGTANVTITAAVADNSHSHTASTISDFNTAADARIAASDKVSSNVTGVTGADQITNMMSLTQAEYDAIGTKGAATFYVIV